MTQPAAAKSSDILIGILCGVAAAFGWAAGFAAAKHGINIGFSPADLAFHRFFWSGLLLTPLALGAARAVPVLVVLSHSSPAAVPES